MFVVLRGRLFLVGTAFNLIICKKDLTISTIEPGGCKVNPLAI